MNTLHPITDKQEKVLQFIRNYLTTNNYAPTMTEIGEYMGISQVSARTMMCSMKRKNIIDWETGKPRTIRILEVA